METLSAPLPVPVVRPPVVMFRLASDARLARLAAKGSQGAMTEIFQRHHEALHRYCHSIVGNGHDAADALQNTMVKALRALPGERRQIALRPWLYRIAHNESISLLRARRPDSDLDAAAHIGDRAAAAVVESRDRLRSLTEDLGELTERQRGALLMRELGGLEFTEVAEALQSSPAAVKQSVYEARRALQAMQEGRSMECEAVRRTLSDGDRRMLRSMQMRGHLRACAGCHDFEVALHQRPAQLGAVIAPLPIAVATVMLHGILGGAAGTSGGGAIGGGLAGSAKATTGFSLGVKAAAVVAVSTTLAGGAIYAVPELEQSRPEGSASHSRTVSAAGATRGIPAASSAAPLQGFGGSGTARSTHGGARKHGAARRGDGPLTAAVKAAVAATGKPAGTSGGKPAGKPGGKRAGTPSGKPAGTPGGKRAATPGGKRAATPGGRPVGSSGRPTATPGSAASTPSVGAAVSGASSSSARGAGASALARP